jgi:AmmeMemoRadiSam system protein B
MADLERPRFRPVQAHRVDHQGAAFVAFADPTGVAEPSLLVPLSLYEHVLRRFDGRATLAEVQAAVLRATGQILSREQLDGIVAQLDAAMVLDGPTFAAFREQYRREGTRPAALAGRSYAGTERALRAQLSRFFAGEHGAGHPEANGNGDAARLRGVLSPHIDFGRGGPTYTWAYRELVERTDATTFVILGVAHQPARRRFVLTRKDFATPLGLARTDRAHVDRIAALAGEHLFEDELVHRTEHSIEFQVVFLQYLLEGRRDFSIVPILVGSFHDLLRRGTDPIHDPEVRRFVEALKAAEAAADGPVAYIGGIDLGHVGPEFGDPHPVEPTTLQHLRAYDEGLLESAAKGDAFGWFERARRADDRWRTCGLAATYTMLHAIGPARGRVLRYDQAVNPERTCCVSFASVAFEGASGGEG